MVTLYFKAVVRSSQFKDLKSCMEEQIFGINIFFITPFFKFCCL